jgi:hypothetical protein
LLRKMRLRCRDGKLQQNRNGNMSISHQRSVILNGNGGAVGFPCAVSQSALAPAGGESPLVVSVSCRAEGQGRTKSVKKNSDSEQQQRSTICRVEERRK